VDVDGGVPGVEGMEEENETPDGGRAILLLLSASGDSIPSKSAPFEGALVSTWSKRSR